MRVNSLISRKMGCTFGALTALLVTACGSSVPAVPVEKPFALGKGGESVEFDFQVKETYGYRVKLHVFFRHSDDLRERKALIDQLGERSVANGTIGNAGVPISLRVRVTSIEVQGPPVDFDQTTGKLGFIDASKDFATKEVLKISNQKLLPGTYHIRVDNLHPVPEFADRAARISVHYDEQGK